MTRPAALVVALAVAGCGGGGELPESWIAAEDEYAVFLTWERSGDELTGSVSGTGIGCDDADPPQCAVQDEERFSLSGTIAGTGDTTER